MIPPQRGGSVTEAKAEHLRFDILEEKKLEKIEKKEKNEAPKSPSENMIDRQSLLLGSLKYVELLGDYFSISGSYSAVCAKSVT